MRNAGPVYLLSRRLNISFPTISEGHYRPRHMSAIVRSAATSPHSHLSTPSLWRRDRVENRTTEPPMNAKSPSDALPLRAGTTRTYLSFHAYDLPPARRDAV